MSLWIGVIQFSPLASNLITVICCRCRVGCGTLRVAMLWTIQFTTISSRLLDLGWVFLKMLSNKHNPFLCSLQWTLGELRTESLLFYSCVWSQHAEMHMHPGLMMINYKPLSCDCWIVLFIGMCPDYMNSLKQSCIRSNQVLWFLLK